MEQINIHYCNRTDLPSPRIRTLNSNHNEDIKKMKSMQRNIITFLCDFMSLRRIMIFVLNLNFDMAKYVLIFANCAFESEVEVIIRIQTST